MNGLESTTGFLLDAILVNLNSLEKDLTLENLRQKERKPGKSFPNLFLAVFKRGKLNHENR